MLTILLQNTVCSALGTGTPVGEPHPFRNKAIPQRDFQRPRADRAERAEQRKRRKTSGWPKREDSLVLGFVAKVVVAAKGPANPSPKAYKQWQ